MKKIIVIVGPTASGKTKVAIHLAKRFNGEIVSADSRQVYRGLDLGTGKDLKEYEGVKYHLIDILEPGEEFSLFKYLELARKAIEEIFSRGKTPIIVGGTGLYVQGLVEGFMLVSNPKLEDQGGRTYSREELLESTQEELKGILKNLDPDSKIDLNNSHRIIRAIERAQEGLIVSKRKPDFDALQIGIDLPREELYERIDNRVEERFKYGMLEEVGRLLNQGVTYDWLQRLGLEYRIISQFLITNCSSNSNKISISQISSLKNSVEFEEMKQNLKYKIHQYSRRQLIWFRRFPEIVWLSDLEKITCLTEGFLKD